MPNITCLNPYYTGIHLHLTAVLLSVSFVACLNPYYTGIHLHSIILCIVSCLLAES